MLALFVLALFVPALFAGQGRDPRVRPVIHLRQPAADLFARAARRDPYRRDDADHVRQVQARDDCAENTWASALNGNAPARPENMAGEQLLLVRVQSPSSIAQEWSSDDAPHA